MPLAIAARSSPGAALHLLHQRPHLGHQAQHGLAAILGNLAADQVDGLDAVGAFVDRQ
jgi:hypothetical protein